MAKKAVRKNRAGGGYDDSEVGQSVQANYQFIKVLFDKAEHEELRDSLYNARSEDEVREILDGYEIDIDPDFRIVVVDIENVRWREWRKADKTYVLVLPPVPTRGNSNDYKNAQAWSAAWYHATNDGYGM